MAKKNNSKGFVKRHFSLLILLLTVFTITTAFVSLRPPTPRAIDTTDWKTQKIKEAHLQFDAPQDAQILFKFNPQPVSSGVKDPPFIDSTGYYYSDGEWYVKFGHSRNYAVTAGEMRNPAGFKILKINGKNESLFGKAVLGTPGSGWIGASIDGLNVAIQMKTTSEYSEDTFDKILSTIEYYAEKTPDMSIDISDWKTYVNEAGMFTLQYPPEWKIKESHQRSNREVDDPEEINTAVFSGNGVKMNVQWSPMGYGGGGCPNYAIIQLKDVAVDSCFVVSKKGFFIQANAPYATHTYKIGFEIVTSGSISQLPTVERVFSTLSFQ